MFICRNFFYDGGMGLTVVINTKNVEVTLPATLKSVAFADQLVVVDMASTDQTFKLAQQAQAEIYQFEDVGYVEPARNFAISKATQNWVLVVDADEVVPVTLKKVLHQIMAGHNLELQLPPAQAYWIPRVNTVFGKEMTATGWWPDYQLRFFKRGSVTWTDSIHQPPQVEGTVAHLPAQRELALQHDNYRSVEEFIDRLNRYTTKHQADDEGGDPVQALQKFREELWRRLGHLQAVKDQAHGIALSLLQAQYESARVLKSWQAGKFSDQLNRKALDKELRLWERDARHWRYIVASTDRSPVMKLVWKLRWLLGV